MSESNSSPRSLPDHSSEEHLRKQAKRRVKQNPPLKLAQAQHQLAREYGCDNWAALMRLVKPKHPVNTPLWEICASSAPAQHRIALAETMLNSGAPVRQACENQSTAIHMAARHGPVEMVQLLLRHGAKEWQADQSGKLPIDYARDGNAPDKSAIVHLLDRPVITDPVFKSAVSAIHTGDIARLRAILNEHPDLLLQRAIEPDCFAPSYFKDPKLLWFVANNPTLMKIVPLNLVEITTAILDTDPAPEDLDYTLELIMTGNSLAQHNQQFPLMQLLIQRGAKPGNLLPVLAHGQLDPIRLLLTMGIPITPCIAAALGQTEDLLRLLPRSSPHTIQDAFCIAVINRQTPAARLCLEAGANVNAWLPVHTHSTALHQAAIHEDLDMLQLLMEHNARLDIRDTLWNATPLGWAIHTHKPQSEKFLRSIGAS